MDDGFIYAVLFEDRLYKVLIMPLSIDFGVIRKCDMIINCTNGSVIKHRNVSKLLYNFVESISELMTNFQIITQDDLFKKEPMLKNTLREYEIPNQSEPR